MDNIIKLSYEYSLNEINIDKVTRGQAKVMLYKDLANHNDIIDAIGPTNKMVLLFPVQSDTIGHWLAILFHPKTNTVEHFDSYGLSPKQEQAYTKNQYVKQGLLNKLYQKAINDGYKFVYNTHRLQDMKAGYDDCGSWSSLKSRFSYLSCNQFAALFLNQTMPPDWIITCLTFLLCKDDVNEEQRIKQIAKLAKKQLRFIFHNKISNIMFFIFIE